MRDLWRFWTDNTKISAQFIASNSLSFFLLIESTRALQSREEAGREEGESRKGVSGT
jgi:hypothetical protein